ncbi:Uncharacterised protein [Candidatus Venteria ishoeyi]|uniref:Uncharacterized protein n=1 Tax=Candidatus Venteria ishoeyi TaxID=1899563 RepID=A0A1H6F5X4_9GAMM|nr:Uncharacterised protein [Candidatus Venteria ishoeyi]
MIIRGNDIAAGHGRVLALRLLYDAGDIVRLPDGTALESGTVPVIDATQWTDAEYRSYVIWDNRSAELSKWDQEILAAEIEDLRIEHDINISDIGFDGEQFESILDEVQKSDYELPPDLDDTEQETTGKNDNHSVYFMLDSKQYQIFKKLAGDDPDSWFLEVLSNGG